MKDADEGVITTEILENDGTLLKHLIDDPDELGRYWLVM